MRGLHSSLLPLRLKSLRAFSAWAVLAAILLGPSLGCGAREASQTAADQAKSAEELEKEKLEKDKKEKEKKEPFEILKVTSRPHDNRKQEAVRLSLKMGHWTTIAYETVSNFEDFGGALTFEVTDAENQRPLRVNQAPFNLVVTRPAVLAKEQPRQLSVPAYIPLEGIRLNAVVRLSARGSGQTMLERPDVIVPMPEHQYNFVVLANEPEAYRHLEETDVVKGMAGGGQNPAYEAHYRIHFLRAKAPLSLPDLPLDWTSIAYLWWDDVDPGLLTSDQQQALSDWLHWGGQLIVSGPPSIEALRGSFLEPWLPATAGESRTIDAAAMKPLADAMGRKDQPLSIAKPWGGVHLIPHRSAHQLPAEGVGEPLVLERRVGRGRIVMTAFRLAQSELRDWTGYTSFLNACLLRRPPRRMMINPVYADASQAAWVSGENYDPRFISQLRYFTRDSLGNRIFPRDREESWQRARADRRQALEGAQQQRRMGYVDLSTAEENRDPPLGGGVASWDDLSAATEMSRDVLRDAAGVTPPNADFVIRMLAIYLVVLVPVNWMIFRAIGRVEWAWVAAPFISIAFAVLVVRQAQLDVGFARARTEIAILETQPRYDRAHLTRYTALYSSLSTTYELSYADSGAVALPCATRRERSARALLSPVSLRRSREVETSDETKTASDVRLSGFTVASNSTGLVHSEQFLKLDGGLYSERLAANRFRVVNDSQFDLLGACFMNIGGGAWIGALAAGESREVELSNLPPQTGDRQNPNPFWSEEIADSCAAAGEDIDLRGLYRLAQTSIDGRDEVCLIAWIDEEMPGLSVAPRVDQGSNATFIFAHMGYAPGRDPQPDLVRYDRSRNDFEDYSGFGGYRNIPDPSTPDASNSDNSNSDASNSDTSNSDTSNSDTSNSDTSNSDTSNSDASAPETSTPDPLTPTP